MLLKRSFTRIGIAVALAIAISLVVFLQTVYAAAWYQTSSGAPKIFAVDAYDADHMIAVADAGFALYTTDGGSNWNLVPTGVPTALYDVDMVSATEAFAVGAGGVAVMTTDGGATWAPLGPIAPVDLYAIDMIDSDTGYAVGDSGIIVKTDGTSATVWLPQIPAVPANLKSVDFLDENTGIAVGETGVIMTTFDGGAAWLPAVSSVVDTLYDVRISSGTSVVVGDNGAYVTSTDKLTWSAGSSPAPANFLALSGIDDDNLIISSDDGTVFLTDDAGSSWSTDVLSAFVYDVAYVSGGLAAVTGVGDIYQYDNTDPTPPSNLSWSEGSPTNSIINILSWDASTDEGSGIDYYEVDIDEAGWGDIGNMTEFPASPEATDGHYTYSVRAVDLAGNTSASASLELILDTVSPTVSDVTPTTAETDSSTDLSVTTSDENGVESCLGFIDDVPIAGTLSGSTFTFSNTFSSAGAYTAYALCTDNAGNQDSGASTTITVSESTGSGSTSGGSSGDTTSGGSSSGGTSGSTETTDVTGLSDIDPNTLIKLACSGETDVNDPCRAVYFYGEDEKRHAFPNEKVFFTWYSDFDSVVVVDSDTLSLIPLGANVTYHPGTKMVKFLTDNRVFAVSKGGVLLPIDNELVAFYLYGDDWNTKIDDISDAFFGNYTFGDTITHSDQYDINEHINSVATVSDNL